MAEGVIRIGTAESGEYPVEFFELLSDGSLRSAATGAFAAAAIDLTKAANLLIGATPASEVQPFGEELYAAIFKALGSDLRNFLDAEESTLFLDIGPVELQAVPWEALHWPKTIPGGIAWARVAAAHHLMRVHRPDWRAARPKPDGPLRILIVSGASDNDRSVGAQQERRQIERSIHDVIPAIDVQEFRGSRNDLYAAIKRFRPHVLHFIGHGTDTPPSLNFTDAGQEPAWDWTAGDIAASIGNSVLDKWTPALVFLNACRTGAAAGLLAPVAGAFLAGGARSVIAMQGDIQGSVAGAIAGAFYREVAAGCSIDCALHIARDKAMSLAGEKQASFPALTLRARPAAVFPGFAKHPAYARDEDTCPYLAKLGAFVNQVGPRRQLHRRLWPALADGRGQFVLIRGAQGFGKTVLGICLLDLAASLGHSVRYVPVGRDLVDYVRILDAIWGRNDPNAAVSPLGQPLPLEPAADLAKLLEESKDPAALYAAFLRALGSLAKARPVTLVLDGFEKKMDAGSFWTMWKHISAGLRGSDMRDVNLILVLADDDCDYYEVDAKIDNLEVSPPSEVVRLEQLKAEEFPGLLDLYLSYRDAWFTDERRQKFKELLLLSGFGDLQPLSIARLEEMYDRCIAFVRQTPRKLRRREPAMP